MSIENFPTQRMHRVDTRREIPGVLDTARDPQETTTHLVAVQKGSYPGARRPNSAFRDSFRQEPIDTGWRFRGMKQLYRPPQPPSYTRHMTSDIAALVKLGYLSGHKLSFLASINQTIDVTWRH